MKSKLLMFMSLFIITTSISFGADVDPTIEFGLMTVDGGATHPTIFTGTEVALKTTKSGFTNVVRTGYFQTKGDDEEIQGFYVWNISEQVLKKDWWSMYLSIGFGVMNEVEDGDDIIRSATMLEFGANMFGKVPLGFGAKLIPEDGAGDKVFLYSRLTFSLP